VLNYLKAQNRPYGASTCMWLSASFDANRSALADIFNNLHGAVGKTMVPKVLASLAERGEITGKAWGKQLVYVARQVIGKAERE
jgi:26S proteasome regulatory subunit (ATPase 3-interacting protein)